MVLLAACTSLGPLSLNLYLPSIPEVQLHFAATVAEVQTTVSLALLAFGLGLVLLGPLTDRYGRRPCLIGGLALFIAGSALAAPAPSLQVLALARVLQSVGCAIAFISARAMVSDVSPREELPRSVAQMTMIMLVVQMVAPLLGNMIMAAGGWRAIQYFGAVLSVSLLVGVSLAQPETLPTAHRSERDRPVTEFLRPTMAVLSRPGFPILLLQAGLLYSAYPAFLSIAPHLMVEAFGRPPTEFAYYFVFLPAGYFAGNAFVLKYGSRFGQDRLVSAGAKFAVFSCLLSILLIAMGVRHPLALFIPAGAMLNIGLGLALPTVSARAVTQSTPHVGSGWGLVGCAQQVMAAVSVQTLGLFSADSPFPVLVLCTGSLLLVVTFEYSRRSARGA
jgi:DHA1 family bicyclomycin/chloramphenicol resistance-like MFS transporter